MIGDTLLNIHVKGDDTYPTEWPILETDKGFYEIGYHGFWLLKDIPSFDEWKKHEDTTVLGLKIVEVFSDAYFLCIQLSDNRSISLNSADLDIQLYIEDKDYTKEMHDLFNCQKIDERPKLQKLTTSKHWAD